MKKCIYIISIFLLMLIVTGCNFQENEIEKINAEQAVKAARTLAQNRLETKPYNYYIVDYEIEEFKVTDKKDNSYEITGLYSISYGLSIKEIFLNITIEEVFCMAWDEDEKWIMVGDTNRKIMKSSAEKLNETQIKSIDQSTYIPFLPSEEAVLLSTKTQIAKVLLEDFMIQATTLEKENKTFIFSAGNMYFNRIDSIKNKSADEEILNCWCVDGGIEGIYIGYMEDYGYSLPYFLETLEELESIQLNQDIFILVERKEGFYLMPRQLFDRIT